MLEDFKKKVDSSVRSWLYKTADSAMGSCTKLVLRHVGAMRGQSVGVYELGEGQASEEVIASMVREICSAAQSDAEGLGGAQRYQVDAHFKDPDSPSGRCTFRVFGQHPEFEGEEGGDFADSEPPTKGGHLAQMMRHTESYHKQSLQMMNAVGQIMAKQMDRQEKIIDKLLTERDQILNTHQELLDLKLDRDLVREKELASQNMKNTAFEKLMLLAPMAINKFAGREIVPESLVTGAVSQIGEIVKAFFISLSTEQAQAVLDLLSIEQKNWFAELHQNPGDEKLVASFVGSLSPQQTAELSGRLRPEQLGILLELQTAMGPHGAEPVEPVNGSRVKH